MAGRGRAATPDEVEDRGGHRFERRTRDRGCSTERRGRPPGAVDEEGAAAGEELSGGGALIGGGDVGEEGHRRCQ